MAETERTRIEPIMRQALHAAVWSALVPIRFGHCDAAGIVFTPRYFDMMHVVIERFFVEALAVGYYDLLVSRRIGLGYAQASCDFLKPSRMGETLDTAVLVDSIGRASYTLVLSMFKEGQEVVRGRFVTVATSLETARPVPLPDDVRAGLEAYRRRCESAD